MMKRAPELHQFSLQLAIAADTANAKDLAVLLLPRAGSGDAARVGSVNHTVCETTPLAILRYDMGYVSLDLTTQHYAGETRQRTPRVSTEPETGSHGPS